MFFLNNCCPWTVHRVASGQKPIKETGAFNLCNAMKNTIEHKIILISY